VPIGAFLLEHLYTNYKAVGPEGPEAFNQAVYDLQTNPAIIYAEIGAIALPLLYHAFYGLFIAAKARINVASQGYLRNWLFFLQRVTGVLVLGYVGIHVYKTRLMPVFDPEGLAEHCSGKMEGMVCFNYMHEYLSGEHLFGIPIVAVYVVGLLSAVFHFSNGLWSMGAKWGVTVGPRAQRTSGYVCAGIGVALAAAGLRSLFAFASI
jgi:succinate dehydrogenase / fumarate reductase cytochrome b subunit